MTRSNRNFYPTMLLAIMVGASASKADGNIANPATQGTQSQIATILAGNWRSPANRARDQYRHPLETLGFFGLKSDATVVEITPGSGWYTEILAPLLHDHGHYIAAIPAETPSSPAEVATNNSKLRARLSSDTAQFGAVTVLPFNVNTPAFGPDATADFVLTFRNVHNWVKAGTAPDYFRAFFAVLKPGGVLGIEDHRAAPGTPLDINSGYLPVDYVIKLATDAGFRLDASSEVNANPKDTKDYPKGVWTLPPALALGNTDRSKYLAIGESDRFTLRFIKPALP